MPETVLYIEASCKQDRLGPYPCGTDSVVKDRQQGNEQKKKAKSRLINTVEEPRWLIEKKMGWFFRYKSFLGDG